MTDPQFDTFVGACMLIYGLLNAGLLMYLVVRTSSQAMEHAAQRAIRAEHERMTEANDIAEIFALIKEFDENRDDIRTKLATYADLAVAASIVHYIRTLEQVIKSNEQGLRGWAHSDKESAPYRARIEENLRRIQGLRDLLRELGYGDLQSVG